MKIYSGSMYGRGTIFVTPGVDHPENSDWVKVTRNEDGKELREPIQFAVKFNHGMAEVDDGLGRYMIDKKLAKRSPVELPADPVIVAAQTTRYATPIPVGRPLGMGQLT